MGSNWCINAAQEGVSGSISVGASLMLTLPYVNESNNASIHCLSFTLSDTQLN